jgi:hypothetical protein
MRYPTNIPPKITEPITEDLLASMGAETWPEVVFILTIPGTSKHATEKFRTGFTERSDSQWEEQTMRGLACYDTFVQAALATQHPDWKAYGFEAQEVTFDVAFDIAKSKPRLNCMILRRSEHPPLIFHL